MAKFGGIIGYVENIETEPGLWAGNITERPYCGDLIRNFSKHESSGGVNDNINIANEDVYKRQSLNHEIRTALLLSCNIYYFLIHTSLSKWV